MPRATAGRASRTCPCSRRSASSRAARRARRSSRVLAQRAPTWLVELPWLLDDWAGGRGGPPRARRARRARGCCARCSRRSTRSAPPRRSSLVLEDLHWADDSTLDLLAALLRRREPARLLADRHLPPGRRRGRAARRRARPRPRRARPRARSWRCRGCPPTPSPPTWRRASRPRRRPPISSTCSRSAPAATRSSCATCSTTGSWDGTLAERGGAVDAHAPARDAGGRRPADAARPHPRPARAAAGRGRRGAERRERRRARLLRPPRSPPRSTATARTSRRRCAALAQRTRLIERARRRARLRARPAPRGALRAAAARRAGAAPRARRRAPGRRLRRRPRTSAPPSSASTSWPGAIPSAPSASCASPPSARSAATPTPRGSATCAPRSTRPTRSAPGSERTRSEVELLSSLGQALVATGGWSAAGGRGGAAARARAWRGGCRTTSRSSPSCSRWRRCTSCAARSAARRTWRSSASGSRRAAGDEHELESSELLACNLFHQGSFARALEYAERGVALFEARRRPAATRPSRRRSATTPASPATTGPGLALWFLGRPDSALARATHALELARDPSRAYSLATARAQMAVVHQCRREPEATLEWAEATIAAAQHLGYVYREAMGRVLRGWALALLGDPAQGIREITGGPRRLARDGRADGRPALPRAARARPTCASGDVDAGLAAVAEALELSRRERSLFYEPELLRLDGALHAVAGEADAAEAALRHGARPGARAGLGDAGAADRHRPRPAAARPGGGRRGARRRARRRTRASPRASARATCARRRRCSAGVGAQAMTPRGGEEGRARRAPRGRRRRSPWSGARASAAGTRSTRSRR